MRKQYSAIAKRAGKAALCAALAVAMVVPANLPNIPSAVSDGVVKAEAADVPEPIMTLDFERGFLGEQAKNDLNVKKSEDLLQFAEVKDENGNYKKDPATDKYIYELNYEKPFIENGDYKYGVDGNQPTTYYDEKFGNTLMLDASKVIDEYTKKNSDELDAKKPIGTVLQEKTKTYSAATIKNPYAGMDFSEEPTVSKENGATWTKGISISYWVKAGVNDQTDTQIANNIYKNDSILFTFQNDSDKIVYQNDDLQKYEAIEAYNACVKEGKSEYIGEYSRYKYTAADFALGDYTTVTDSADPSKSYQIISNYGKLVRLNPDYQGTTTNKFYFTDKTKTNGEDASYTDENGNKVLLFELGQNVYKDFCTFDVEQGSKIKYGRINGSLTIATSNSFAFKEDDYRTESTTNEDGVVVSVAVEGAKQENKNADKYNELYQLRHYNCMYFQGDGLNCEEDENGETAWHHVTCVIQNDWVQFYVDGELFDGNNADWYYSPSNNLSFNQMNASKYFNCGYGLRAPYNKTEGVDDWSPDGTLVKSPANSICRTMLDWISDPETVLMIGGQGTSNLGLEAQEIGNGDGTLLDDIKFYDVPLTEEQAVAVYEEAAAEKNAEPTSTLLKQYDFDGDALYAMPAGMEAAASNKTGSSLKPAVVINGTEKKDSNPIVVNDATRGHVLAVFGGNTSATSSTVFENPYAGKDDITGVTVSYWYKSLLNTKKQVSNSIGLSFNDEPKIIVHDKIQESSKNSQTRTGLWITTSLDTTFEAGYDTKVFESLKDKYITSSRYGVFTDPAKPGYMEEAAAAQTEWTNRTNSFADWHYVTMVATNAGITMYYDGTKLPNNLIDDKKEPSFYGPRFYDGYYTRIYDGFAKYKIASNNQTAPGIMGFLTQADTKAYVGLAYNYGNNKTFQGAERALYDDISYYAGAMTDDQVAALYKEAAAKEVKAVDGEEIWNWGDTAEPTPTDDPTPVDPTPAPNPEKPIDDKKPGEKNEDGSITFNSTATGVKVTAPAGALPDDAEMVVSILGTSADADRYANADAVLKGISGLSVGSRILYDIHFEKDGQTIQPTAAVTVELTPYTGYTASKCKVVYIDGKAVVSTTTSGNKLVFTTQNLGEFALVQAASANNVSGNANNTSKSSKTGTANAGKTGDVANVMLPLLLLAAAAAAIVIARKKKVTE